MRVGIFNAQGQQIDEKGFNDKDLADKFCKAYCEKHSGFALILFEPATEEDITHEVTPQDLGKPSPVPYSVYIKRPSPDIDPKGREQINITLALADLSERHLEAVPNEIRPFFRSIRLAFNNGYYRFELVVGDWSIRVYKHPNNP